LKKYYICELKNENKMKRITLPFKRMRRQRLSCLPGASLFALLSELCAAALAPGEMIFLHLPQPLRSVEFRGAEASAVQNRLRVSHGRDCNFSALLSEKVAIEPDCEHFCRKKSQSNRIANISVGKSRSRTGLQTFLPEKVAIGSDCEHFRRKKSQSNPMANISAGNGTKRYRDTFHHVLIFI
jgi:hypothetical protein